MVPALSRDAIRVRPSPRCIVCGSEGANVYHGLDDVLFGAPGEWSMSRCVNRGCGLLWLEPQPVEEDIGKAYTEYYTHHDAATHPSLPKRAYRQIRSSYLRSRLGYDAATSFKASSWLAPFGGLHPGGGDVFAAAAMFLPAPERGAALLDVGSGAGDFISTMQRLGWKVAGVETDGRAVERARARNLDVHLGELEGAAYPSATFNAITMAHVLEHVHDPRRLLAECRRILKPNGRLVILTPNSDSWGHRRFGRDWRGLEPPRHIHLFNSKNVSVLVRSAQLRPDRISTLAINASAVWAASAAIHRKRSKSATWMPAAAGIAFQLAERIRLGLDSSAGEDLIAIATRVD
jgi:2-polyprenyl-3-methyl-5-hydroxy-6-metoxy-1,4-benzoquinol methylase